MATTYATQADLERAVGGAKILLQLADFSRTGNIADAAVQATIEEWLEDGAAEFRGKAEIKHDPETLDNLDAPSLRRARDCNAAFSARVAYERSTTGGLAMPEGVRERAERCDAYCTELAEGKARLGRVAGGKVPAVNQAVGVMDYDPRGQGISITGFKRGFR